MHFRRALICKMNTGLLAVEVCSSKAPAKVLLYSSVLCFLVREPLSNTKSTSSGCQRHIKERQFRIKSFNFIKLNFILTHLRLTVFV